MVPANGVHMRALLPLFATASVLAGLVACNNACQSVCVEMAQFAEDECGFTISDEQLDACREEQKEATGDEKAACRAFGDVETIAEEWGCDELEDYFGSDGA